MVFGKEPTDVELYQYFLKNFDALEFTDSCPVMPDDAITGNPKRRKREIGKKLHEQSGAKKSYEIIQQSIKQSKKKIRLEEKRRKETEADCYKYLLKREKRKEKQQGH